MRRYMQSGRSFKMVHIFLVKIVQTEHICTTLVVQILSCTYLPSTNRRTFPFNVPFVLNHSRSKPSVGTGKIGTTCINVPTCGVSRWIFFFFFSSSSCLTEELGPTTLAGTTVRLTTDAGNSIDPSFLSPH